MSEPTAEACRFDIAVARADGEVRLTLQGEIDLAARDDLDYAVDLALGDAHRLVLDMRDVSFLDSTGIGALARAVRGGARVSLLNPRPSVRRVLELTGIDKHIRIVSADHKQERTDDGTP